jgi:lipopolysaccharide/colanic/teichoic acid biosynthesis glycosyltransferase
MVAVPVRVTGEGVVARTTTIALDNALLPSYRQVGPRGPSGTLQLRGGEEVNSPTLQLPVLETPGEGLSYAVKRSCDLLAAIPLSLVILPTLAVLSTVLRIGGRGPVFHSQIRLTLGGRPFRLYKLRTMNIDAEPTGAPVWPQSSDVRITPLGHFLRRFWIDEWPQILNVLRGDLSLIGPRPERPDFVKEFILYLPKYNERHRAVCGVTGLSQALGFAGNTSLKKRLFLDRLYIQKWSPWFDLRVLLLTALHLFNRQTRRQFDYTPGTGQTVP